jgi:hypothetical protein
MDALPPHYALVKYRTGEDAMPQVMRVYVLFFPPDDRDFMIDQIISRFKAVDEYSPDDHNIYTYVDKGRVLVDGNTFDAFNRLQFIEFINELRTENKDDYTGDETFLSLGTPRLMARMKAITITSEARENIILVARSIEQACCAAIISSAIQSYLAQGKKVQVWAYEKNRMFLTYRRYPWKSEEFSGVQFREGMHSVCNAIYETKQKILSKQPSNELIVLIGMDRICADFEFIEGSSNDGARISVEQLQKAREEELSKKGALVASQLDQIKRDTVAEWAKLKNELQAQAGADGKSAGEIETLLKEAKEKLYSEKRQLALSIQSETQNEADSRESEAYSEDSLPMPTVRTQGEYDAMNDFQYIVKQGSRNGYHFLLCLNSFADLKQTMLKLDLFRHRLAFQVPDDDSRDLFNSKVAGSLPEHICQYYDTLERYSFRPYIHKGIAWDDWDVNDDGEAYRKYV